jgi:2-dehydro-3-deoxyphosphogluconate aldolase / (4S)-4-hydroxy-2-oxoglutarate aldolase
MEMLKQLSLAGLVPVIKITDAADAVPLCRALADGGLPVAEITFRTGAAEESIRRVHEALPDILLGAGTVLSTEQADKAMAAGAGYIVSPGLNPAVVAHCVQRGYPVLPGCANPSDIEAALSFGLKTVKFFPAEALGGLKLIKAMSAPYGDVTFVPTGGIDEKNLADYLAFGKVAACGGSWMVPEDAIKVKDWVKITRLTADAVKLMLGIEIRHIGINTQDKAEAERIAALLSALTGWAVTETSKSYFAGTGMEIMHGKGPGANGHIALTAASVDRAVWHMQRRGFAFDESTAKRDAAGKCSFIYLKDEVAGFGIHLNQK